MNVTIIVLLVVSFIFNAFVLWYAIKISLVYHRFNEQISEWSRTLDDEMVKSINRASMVILKQMDEKISQLNEVDEENDELNNNDLNTEE